MMSTTMATRGMAGRLRGSGASGSPVNTPSPLEAEPFGVVESTKAVSDVYAPISGEVAEVNDDLPDSPELVNEDPYGDGWLVKINVEDASELDDLMTAAEYRAFLESPEEE